MHLLVTSMQALLDALKRLCHGLLALKLESHLLVVTSQLHEVSVSFYVRFLFLFVPIDPDLTRVFFSGNNLALLIDLVQQLLPLDVILLFE